jgi:hypothetical protein
LHTIAVIRGKQLRETIGILAAALNTTFGGLAVGVTRYVIPATDPITLGAMRFGIGGLLMLPFALLRLDRWPRGADLGGVVGLGLLYFGLYPVLFNAALSFTTAARGALALSTAPPLYDANSSNPSYRAADFSQGPWSIDRHHGRSHRYGRRNGNSACCCLARRSLDAASCAVFGLL